MTSIGPEMSAGPVTAQPIPGLPTPQAAVIEGVNIDAVATAVAACAGVSGLSGGRFGEVGTYLPGRRVAGIQVGAGVVTVQVRARWGVPAGELSRQIRTVLAGAVGRRRVDIVVADIDDPPGQSATAPAALTVEPTPTPASPAISPRPFAPPE